ncbi:MAG: molybdopterin-dependent oxidoreductase [Bacteroidetes bacterium]|nr:molybdopterin-dependent oxidoreductase [Bacteroidota bacterium]
MCNFSEKKQKKMQDKNDACIVPINKEDSAKYISKKIEIIGEVEKSLILTVDSLIKMNVTTIENFKVVCQSGANMKENKSCKGVLLKDILNKAKIKQHTHKDRNFYIVARATDNYKATFSWAEIFNNPTGENVYVIFEENGNPIKAQGDMILICTNDIKTGPRHVYWLKSIEVNRVD